MESKSIIYEYLKLGKFKLSLLVAVTANIGYIIAVTKVQGASFQILPFLLLFVGGFFLSAASNALNQVIERDSDKLMTRTNDRPLVSHSITINQAIFFAVFASLGSTLILAFTFNSMVALLGLISLCIYAFMYTPMKKVSPVSAFVGAIPGAMPPMLGFIAITGVIDYMALVIFGIQFFWQFVHFWSLTWLLHEDYLKAGYFMLPSRQGKSRRSAFQILWYAFLMTVTSVLPYVAGFSGITYLVTALVCGLLVMWFSLRLYKTLENKDAKNVMLSSYIHIVFVLIAMVF